VFVNVVVNLQSLPLLPTSVRRILRIITEDFLVRKKQLLPLSLRVSPLMLTEEEYRLTHLGFYRVAEVSKYSSASVMLPSL